MIYCDLSIDGAQLWSGVSCMNGVPINTWDYIPFAGTLIFTDTAGAQDPSFEGLNTRWLLLYYATDDALPLQVPLQATPAQQLNIILGSQNCTISLYQKSTDGMEPVLDGEIVYADMWADGYYYEIP